MTTAPTTALVYVSAGRGMEDERAVVLDVLAGMGLSAAAQVNSPDSAGLVDTMAAAGLYLGIYGANEDENQAKTEVQTAVAAQVPCIVFAQRTRDGGWYTRLEREFPDLRLVPFGDVDELRRLVPDTVRLSLAAVEQPDPLSKQANAPPELPYGRLATSSRTAVALTAVLPGVRTASGMAESQALLAGLYFSAPDGPTRSFLGAFGLNPQRFVEALRSSGVLVPEAWLTTQPTADALPSALSPEINAALVLSERLADGDGSPEAEPRHLLLALFTVQPTLQTWLAGLIGTQAMLWTTQTLRSWPRDESFSEAAITGRAVRDGLGRVPTAFSDNAADKDLLGFDVYASALASIVLKPETAPPLVVGIYGPWGSGKSTFLRLVERQLTDRAGSAPTRLITVRYNAWEYADAPKLWAGLVAQIAKQLDADLGFWRRLLYVAQHHGRRLFKAAAVGLLPVLLGVLGLLLNVVQGALSDTVAWLAVLGGGVLTLLQTYRVQREAVSSSVVSLAGRYNTQPVDGVLKSVQDELEKALTASTDGTETRILSGVRSKNLKIVVFIDELDRCPLEQIVNVLEAIKLVLARDIFIVFLAIDTRVAAEAIRLRYPDVGDPELAREYLEKIVQIPLRVPTARSEDITTYLSTYMPQAVESKRATEAPPASTQTPTTRSVDAAGTAPAAPHPTPAATTSAPPVVDIQARPELKDTPLELAVMSDIGEAILDGNPRRIKRMLNTYRYVKILSNARGEAVQSAGWQSRMLGWLAFTIKWPAFMDDLVDELLRMPYLPKGDTDMLLRRVRERTATSASVDAVPREEFVTRFLPIGAHEIRDLWRSAPNFLIESPSRSGESVTPAARSNGEVTQE